MRSALAYAVTAAALAAASSCGGRRPSDVHVLAWAADVGGERGAPIEIRFDRPVVSQDEIGAPALPTSILIEPPIAWRGTWRDRSTLVIDPLSALAPSTRYRVELAGLLRARAGGLAFSFVHRPLVVEGVWGADASALDPAGDIPLAFDQPVVPGDAAAYCRLVGAAGAIALEAAPGPPAPELALHPVHALAPGGAYTLACAGLTGAGGNAPLDRPYTLLVRARPALAIARIEPAGGAVSPDDATLAISFTTPVTLAAARDAVTANPPIPGLDRGTLSADGMTYAVRAELASDTEYRIAIAALSDRFGQTLASPVEARFHTASGPPRLVVPRGVSTVDGRAPLAVWSRDVPAFTIACAPLGRARAAALAIGGEADPLDVPAHPVAAIADSRWHPSALDLAAPCGRGHGLYLVELRAPGAERARVLADVTELGVVVDLISGAGLVWVTSRATGQPIAGARVTVTTTAGQAIASDLSGADGLVRLPGRAAGAAPWLVTVEHAGEVALVVAGDGVSSNLARGRLDDDPPGEPAADPEPPAPPPVERAPLVLAVHAPPVVPHVGDRLAFEVEARTATGAPVRGARIAWSLARARHPLHLDGFDDFSFGDDLAGAVSEGAGTTDELGRIAIAARDPAPPAGGPIDYVLTATGTSDLVGAAAPAQLALTAEPASLAVGLRVAAIAGGGSTDGAGPHELAASLVALGPDGAPVAARVHLTIERVERACDVVMTPGRDLPRCDERRRKLAERDVVLTDGTAREEQVELAEPGAYVVRAELRDDAGRTIAASREVWIPGAGDAAWQDGGRLAPVTDRACYRAGDIARLAPRAGSAPATALVAIESPRRAIVETRVVALASGTDALELAIAQAYAPGVRARVVLVRGRDAGATQLATGAIDLSIGCDERAIYDR